jgi:Protein of unknown function (DUF3375)
MLWRSTTSRRRDNAAWRLLVADNAPLILGFLDRVFLTPNVRQMPGPELVDALDDHYPGMTVVGSWYDYQVGCEPAGRAG